MTTTRTTTTTRTSTTRTINNAITTRPPEVITCLLEAPRTRRVKVKYKQHVDIQEGIQNTKKNEYLRWINLRTVTFPSSFLTAIMHRTFGLCTSLETISIPNTVQLLFAGAFFGCTNLKSVSISPTNSSLMFLDYEVFEECTSLESFTIPNRLQAVGSYCFMDCISLKSLIFPQDQNSSLRKIHKFGFESCLSLQSHIIIPNTVDFIGMAAFKDCKSIPSVILPQPSFEALLQFTFQGCASMQFVMIPISVKKLRQKAFANCTSLQIISLPMNMESIEEDVFVNCDALQSVSGNDFSWLKGRFDSLPIHDMCYRQADSITKEYLDSFPLNDPCFLAQDAMGLTPLHVLCSNPLASTDIIKHLYSRNSQAALVENVNGMSAWHMYVVGKSLLKYEDFVSYRSNEGTGLPSRIVKLLDDPTILKRILQPIVDTNMFDIIDVSFTLIGLSMNKVYNDQSQDTGLYPFMSMAASDAYRMSQVYEMAMQTNPSNMKKHQVSRKRKRT